MGGPDLTTTPALVERDAEVALLRRLTAGVVAGRAAVVEIAGPPGVGRSSLVAAAMAHAEHAGLRVRYARCSHTETALTGGMVAQVLAGLTPLDPLPSPMALCQTFLTVARQGPLLVALDDAHWTDEYSRQWLLAVLRRIGEVPLMIVYSAGQPGLASRTAVAEAQDLAVDAGAEWHVLRPAVLSVAGVRQVLAEAGGAQPEDGFVRAVLQRTCGLPRLFRGVTEALRDGAFTATVAHVPSLEAGMRVDVSDWADEMLTELSPPQLALLRAILVGEGDLDWDLLVQLARLDAPTAARTLERLREQSVPIAGDPPRLACPHTHARVLAHLSVAEREQLFAAAAELGQRAAIGSSALARLLCSAPVVGQDWAVRALTEAAARADAEGRAEDAGRLLARALREPLDEVSRAALLTDLASIEVTHAPEASDRRLVRVIAGPGGEEVGPLRVRAADLLMARGSTESLRDAVTGALGRTLSEADRAALEAMYLLAVDGPHDGSVPAPALSEAHGDPARAATLAWRLLVRGEDRDRTLALARVTLAAGPRAPLSSRIAASRALLLGDDVAEAARGLDAVLVDAMRRRDRTVAAWARLMRADLGSRTGRLDDAAEDIERALTMVPFPYWHPMTQPTVLALRTSMYLEAGQLDSAAELVATELLPGVESGVGWARFLYTKGVFLLLTGEPAGAVEHLREVGRRLLARQWVNPALANWRSFAALAHRACGNSVDAERLVTEELVLARRWGAASMVGSAQLAASMVLDGPARLDSLRAAVDVLRDSPARLRYIKALLELATEYRDAGAPEESARVATEAGELARSHGAGSLAKLARTLGWEPFPGTVPGRD
ncbi:ATP-binding protein [Actinophytocola sp.]|uniref:ATP-binding protein n=1 Tax=Actinophytocola sp. TaxID=1872138 RepID=UPI002ED438A8